jgi:hypothetical protein
VFVLEKIQIYSDIEEGCAVPWLKEKSSSVAEDFRPCIMDFAGLFFQAEQTSPSAAV